MRAIIQADQYDRYGKRQADFFVKIMKRYGKITPAAQPVQEPEAMMLTLIQSLGKREKNETILEQISYISHNTIHVTLNLLLQGRAGQNLRARDDKERQEEKGEEQHREEMSAYDRYVQTSWLKEIYKTYRGFTELVAQRVPEKGSVHYPVVTLLMKKNAMPGQTENRQDRHEVTYSESDTRLHIEKTTQMIENGGYDRDAATQTVYANLDMKHIAGQVYRDIEEKLRYERLKKGL